LGGDPCHVTQPPVELARFDEVFRGAIEEVPIFLLPSVEPRILRLGEIPIQDRSPREKTDVGQELGVPQLRMTSAPVKAVHEFPRIFYAASQHHSENSAGVLGSVRVYDKSPVGERRAALGDDPGDPVARPGGDHEQAGARRARTRSEQGD